MVLPLQAKSDVWRDGVIAVIDSFKLCLMGHLSVNPMLSKQQALPDALLYIADRRDCRENGAN